MKEDYGFSASNNPTIKSTLNKTKLKMKGLNTYFSIGNFPVFELMYLQVEFFSSLGGCWW